jgi:peroxiredoxin
MDGALVTASRRAGALALLLALLTVWPPPVPAQVDTDEDREREEARDSRLEKAMPPWQYDLYRRQRDRNKLKDKTELDRLVERAQLFSLVGKDPPSFTLLRSDGKRVGLSDFAGQVVLLYFWSTAAPHASEELSSSIDKLQRELLARRFTVLAVNVREKPEEVTAWAKGRGLSSVFLLDTEGDVADIYKVRAVPTIYVIGRDHKLVGRLTGARSWDQGPTRELIDYLLKEPAR